MPNLKSLLNKDYQPPNLSELDEVVYCLNCVNQVDGKIGVFAFDDTLYKSTGTHFAITEVFMTVDGLLDFLRGEGFTEHPREEMLTVRRQKNS